MRFAPKDERIYFYQRGKPLGEWEREHRLHIDQPASDEIFEIGNVYRIDSTCLEITDESQTRVQLAGMLLLICAVAVGFSLSSGRCLHRHHFMSQPKR